MSHRTRLVLTGLGAAFAWGCGANNSVSTVQVITKVAGDSQTGLVGAALAVRPAVRVTDADNLPVTGVAVSFTISDGGGTIAAPNAITGANGIATSGDWKLGPKPGANDAVAAVSNATVHFAATAFLATDTLLGLTGARQKP